MNRSPRGKEIMAEQDNPATSPSKGKNIEVEGLPEAKHLRIDGDISPASFSQSSDTISPLKPLENILIKAEQDNTATSPSKRKNIEAEGLPEAKHLKIDGDISPASFSQSSDTIAPLTPLENSMIKAEQDNPATSPSKMKNIEAEGLPEAKHLKIDGDISPASFSQSSDTIAPLTPLENSMIKAEQDNPATSPSKMKNIEAEGLPEAKHLKIDGDISPASFSQSSDTIAPLTPLENSLIKAEQDNPATSPSKRKNIEAEGLPEAKHLKIEGDISPASLSQSSDTIPTLTPLENSLIDQYLQCLNEREQLFETLFGLWPQMSPSWRTDFRETKDEETRAVQQLRRWFQDDNGKKELLDGVLDCSKMNAALRETKDALASTLMEQLKVDEEIKGLVNDLAYLKMNRHTQENEVQEGSSSSSKRMED